MRSILPLIALVLAGCFAPGTYAQSSSDDLRNLLRDATNAIELAGRALDDVEASVDAATDGIISIEGGVTYLEGHAIRPLVEEPQNWTLVYLPNITTNGASSKRYRFMTNLDRDQQLWRSGYLFATAEDATAAAQAMIDLFARLTRP